MTPHCFCLETDYHLNAFKPDKCIAFKSAMAPLLLVFNATHMVRGHTDTSSENSTVRVIFKNGDDLRQDQLILQIIALMDTLLKKVNIDLKLTPYKTMAWGKEDGVLECVLASKTLQEVLEDHKQNLDAYFKKLAKQAVSDHNSWFFKQNPDLKKNLDDKESIQKAEDQAYYTILNNYIDSCAGYCVITYLLGIGDRHLENLMLTEQGDYRIAYNLLTT